MDFNDYWQENKRFVTIVTLGFATFVAARLLIGSSYDGDINAARRKITGFRNKLAQPMYGPQDLADARGENERLVEAVERLKAQAAFDPRAEFLLDTSAGSASNQYLRSLSRVREDLLPRANRANLKLDSGLGMPNLSPTREAEIERYLEALDAIETLCLMAIDSRVQRIDRIQVRLDPGLNSREGLGEVERTRVSLTVFGDSLALTRLLTHTQRPGEEYGGRALRIGEVEVIPSRSKEDEVRLDLTLILARLHSPEGPGEEEA